MVLEVYKYFLFFQSRLLESCRSVFEHTMQYLLRLCFEYLHKSNETNAIYTTGEAVFIIKYKEGKKQRELFGQHNVANWGNKSNKV